MLRFRSRRRVGEPDADLATKAEPERGLLDALDRLQATPPDQRDPEIESRLVRLRHQAFAELDRSAGRATWPPVYADHFPDVHGRPPEVSAAELTADLVGSGIQNHGAVLVRGLAGAARVEQLIEGIDRTFAGRDEWGPAGATPADTAPWYEPFEPDPALLEKPLSRRWVREGGGVWAADSPRMLSELVDTFRAVGLDRVIAGYLGERPAVSVRKCTLRRVPYDMTRADWHQDGAFLGEDVRSLNVWVALTPCGGTADAPGLDVVPRRIDDVLETGTDGAFFDWSVGPGLIERMAGDVTVMRPQFEAGDALLFDDRFLHRTSVGPEMARERYAIESWFFAPSTYPMYQLPLVF